MYKSNTFTVSKEVEVNVDVTIDEVMENIDHDKLFEALVEYGNVDATPLIADMDADDVLNELEHYEIINYVASQVDTSDMLDAFKEQDPDGLHEWLKANDDIVNPDWNPNKVEEPKPEPVVIKRPVVTLIDEGRMLVDGQDVGTYKVFGGVIAVDAFGVQFMANTLNNATEVLNAIAFANANQEV